MYTVGLHSLPTLLQETCIRSRNSQLAHVTGTPPEKVISTVFSSLPFLFFLCNGLWWFLQLLLLCGRISYLFEAEVLTSYLPSFFYFVCVFWGGKQGAWDFHETVGLYLVPIV